MISSGNVFDVIVSSSFEFWCADVSKGIKRQNNELQCAAHEKRHRTCLGMETENKQKHGVPLSWRFSFKDFCIKPFSHVSTLLIVHLVVVFISIFVEIKNG